VRIGPWPAPSTTTPTVFILSLEHAERPESKTSDRSEKAVIALGPPDE